MDPARNLIHLGLKVTETTLDRAVELVRLADTLLVAQAAPDARERSEGRRWPAEEEADLDAASDALRAKAADEDVRPARKPAAATKSASAKGTSAKKSAAKKSSAKTTPAKKSTAKTAPAKKSTARTAPAKKSTAKKTSATSAPAKKSTARKTAAKKTAAKAAPRKAGE